MGHDVAGYLLSIRFNSLTQDGLVLTNSYDRARDALTCSDRFGPDTGASTGQGTR
jgi:hypothetical protein